MKPRTHHVCPRGLNTRLGLRRALSTRLGTGRSCRGWTLIELVVSVAIAATIMLGIASSILIAARALPDAETPANAAITAGAAAEQIAAEMQYAISVNGRSARHIEFTVADRSGDDVPETIHYEWSGTAGQPLTRKYNNGTTVNVIDKVYEFNLSYDLEVMSKEIRPQNESSETLLIQYDSTENLQDYSIKETDWYGQYFLPTLPADASSWKVTRIRFFAKRSTVVDGQAKVQLQLPTAGKVPGGAVLEEKTLVESSLLEDYVKQEFVFSNVANLSPQKGLCLVIAWAYGDVSCRVRGRNSGAGTSNSFMVQSTNRGASWSALTAQSLLFWVYGTVTTPGQPQVQNTYYLKGVEIKLRIGADAQSTVCTRTSTPNRPEVTQ